MIHCCSIREEHIPEVLDIANTQLGKHYLKADEIRSYMKNASQCVDVALNERGQVVGFNMVNTIFNKGLERFIIKGKDEIINYFPDKSFVHWHKILCVHKDHQKKGVGTILFEFTYDRINPITEFWIGCAWASGKKIHVGNIFLRHGFTKKNEIDNYWYEDSFLKNYQCANCGNPPCECSAFIFIKK